MPISPFLALQRMRRILVIPVIAFLLHFFIRKCLVCSLSAAHARLYWANIISSSMQECPSANYRVL